MNQTENLFDVYDKSRNLKDLQPLYNLNIFLHELTHGGNNTERTANIDTDGKHLVKMYDQVNGKFVFTKILVFGAKKVK